MAVSTAALELLWVLVAKFTVCAQTYVVKKKKTSAVSPSLSSAQ